MKLSKKYEKIKEKKLLRGFSFLFCLISGSREAEKKMMRSQTKLTVKFHDPEGPAATKFADGLKILQCSAFRIGNHLCVKTNERLYTAQCLRHNTQYGQISDNYCVSFFPYGLNAPMKGNCWEVDEGRKILH